MKRVMQGIGDLLRLAFSPPAHPIAAEVEQAAQQAERQSAKLDEFATMIEGMRSQGSSARPKKKQQSKTRRG